MALDYYLEIKQYGTKANQILLHNLIQSEFMLTDHNETNIMTGIGLGVSVFIDSDDELEPETEKQIIPSLFVNFRVDKGQLRQGYQLLLSIVQKILDTFDTDLRLIDESDDNVLLERNSKKISRFLLKHDLWLTANRPLA